MWDSMSEVFKSIYGRMSPTDWIVFVSYFCLIVFIGLWVSRTKEGEQKNSQDYFLAARSLPWWAIGTSLIAANISAEHFIGMSGSGYKIGLAIACYEWIAAAALIIVGKYFLPIFLEKKIYTMPQFLEQRFDRRVSMSFSVFWLLVYVFVNLTSVSYLGALAMDQLLGVPLMYGIIFLMAFSALYSLWGGLMAVAWTDVVQVVFLVGGGLMTTYLALHQIGGGFVNAHGTFYTLAGEAANNGGSLLTGLKNLYHSNPVKFDLVLSPDNPNYSNLPGLAVLLGFQWLVNLGYWGFNQYIIQRGLAARSTKDAQDGLVFAGYLKLLVPVIVVIPGIAAYVLTAGSTEAIPKPDAAYPWLVNNIVPLGLRGLVFAALIAAIASSLSSMVNSISTIFTMDIYRHVRPQTKEHQLVIVGRITAVTAILIGTLVAPALKTLDQAFQYIQEYTGFVYPGLMVVYALGLFWRQMTSNAALMVCVFTLPLGFGIKGLYPNLPFPDRMGYVFIVLSAIAVIMTLLDTKSKALESPAAPEKFRENSLLWGYGFSILGVLLIFPSFVLKMHSLYVTAFGILLIGLVKVFNNRKTRMAPGAIVVDRSMYFTDAKFNVAAVGIIIILTLLYGFLY